VIPKPGNPTVGSLLDQLLKRPKTRRCGSSSKPAGFVRAAVAVLRRQRIDASLPPAADVEVALPDARMSASRR
jgi:hypothetical protein